MRRHRTLPILLAAGLVAGCSGSLGQGAAPRTGIEAAPYVLSDSERAADCKELAYLAGRSVQAINALPVEAQKEKARGPATVVRLVGHWSGDDVSAFKEFDRERARADALNKALAAKGCPQVDVDGQTKDAAKKIADLRK